MCRAVSRQKAEHAQFVLRAHVDLAVGDRVLLQDVADRDDVEFSFPESRRREEAAYDARGAGGDRHLLNLIAIGIESRHGIAVDHVKNSLLVSPDHQMWVCPSGI